MAKSIGPLYLDNKKFGMNKHSFKKSNRPLLFVYQIFGLSPLQRGSKTYTTWKTFDTIVSVVWLLCITGAGVYCTLSQSCISNYTNTLSTLTLPVYLLSILLWIESAILLLTCITTRKQHIREIINLFVTVDTLLSYNSSLNPGPGHSFNPAGSFRITTTLMSLFVSFIAVFGVCNAVGWFEGRWNSTMFLFRAYSLLWQMQFLGCVLAVRDRMDMICSQLLSSVRPPLCGENDLDEVATLPGGLGTPRAAAGELRRLQRARLALARAARLCGRHFGPALALATLTRLVLLVTMSYGLILLARRNALYEMLSFTAVYFVWLLAIAGGQLAICWACSSATDKALTAGRILGRMLPLVRSCVQPDALHIPVERLAFSAAGFFDIDLPLFVGMVGAVATYVVILVQFSPV